MFLIRWLMRKHKHLAGHKTTVGCAEIWAKRFSDSLMLQIRTFRYFWPFFGPAVVPSQEWLKFKVV